MAKLECSKSTLHRAIATLKDHLNAPVVFDADAGGYKYGKPETGEAYELPGLWFTATSCKRSRSCSDSSKTRAAACSRSTWARSRSGSTSSRSTST